MADLLGKWINSFLVGSVLLVSYQVETGIRRGRTYWSSGVGRKWIYLPVPKGRWAGLWAHLKSAAFILRETNQYGCVVFPALPGCQGDISRKVNLTMCWAFSIFLFRPSLHLPSLGLVSGWLPFMNDPVDSFASELALPMTGTGRGLEDRRQWGACSAVPVPSRQSLVGVAIPSMKVLAPVRQLSCSCGSFLGSGNNFLFLFFHT